MVLIISGRDPKTIERCNLLNVSKLIIKEVIDSSLSHGRMLDDNHVPLQQFFIVLEHVLRHGLKRTFMHSFSRKDANVFGYLSSKQYFNHFLAEMLYTSNIEHTFCYS